MGRYDLTDFEWCAVPVNISIRKGVDLPPFGRLIPMSTEHAVNTKIRSISALKQM